MPELGRPGVFIDNFEHISRFLHVFLLLILNKKMLFLALSALSI